VSGKESVAVGGDHRTPSHSSAIRQHFPRAAARTRAGLPEIKGPGRPTRSSGGRSIG
jgi:hypothetical protein